jgi:HK97 family phage prohead protease
MGTVSFGAPMRIQEVKADGDDWEVSGYASTFGNVDLGFDVVLPGAFDKTLADGHRIGFLHSHDPRLVLGVPKKLKADKKGLFGQFKISKTTLGNDTRQLLMDGAFGGFSIGYSTIDAEFSQNGDVRQLKEVELFEVSVVALPMNPEAVVTGVKDYLARLGVSDELTMAEKTRALCDALTTLIRDTRGLADSRPLNESKRQELEALLETFSGMDDVRSSLKALLAATPVSRVNTRRLLYELAERRTRFAPILKEQI